jgi:hypothetical protein
MSCNFSPSTFADDCLADFLECTTAISWVQCEGLDYPCPPGDSNAGGGGTCALPQEIYPCDPTIGCQDGGSTNLVCTAGFPTTTGTATLCAYPCSHSSDCANISESCQHVGTSHVCSYNYCDYNSSGTFVGPFWDACNAAGSNDGQCLSYSGGSGAVCYQNGTAAAGEACSMYRTGSSPACVFGQFCTPSAADYNTGVCLQLTDIPDGGHPCNPSTYVAVQTVIGADFSVCAKPCQGNGDCASNLTCQTITGAKVCLP